MEEWSKKYITADFEDRERWPWTKECERPPEAEKTWNGFPLELPESSLAQWNLR